MTVQELARDQGDVRQNDFSTVLVASGLSILIAGLLWIFVGIAEDARDLTCGDNPGTFAVDLYTRTATPDHTVLPRNCRDAITGEVRPATPPDGGGAPAASPTIRLP